MDPFIGEIRIFGFGVIPTGWMPCDGRSLARNTYQALFTLLKTTFGSVDQDHFSLPDFRGRIPVGTGTGDKLTPRAQGDTFGTESELLDKTTLPAHSHSLMAMEANAQSAVADGNLLANGVIPGRPPQAFPTYISQAPNAPMLEQALDEVGSGGSHENRQPFLALNYCIAVFGVYPPHPDSAEPKK